MKVSWLTSKKANIPGIITDSETKGENMKELKLSAPWVVYFRQIESLFGEDPEIKVEFDEENIEVKLFVENESKADAIAKLLPMSKKFGNVELKITVIPANAENWKAQIVSEAFKGNPAVVDIKTIKIEEMSNPMCFVIFKKEVVQYFSDNAGDYHGLTSTLYQDLAKELIPAEGIYYCTDNEMDEK